MVKRTAKLNRKYYLHRQVMMQVSIRSIELKVPFGTVYNQLKAQFKKRNK